MTALAAMRFCGGCSTIWAVEPQVNPDARDSTWFCPKCSAARSAAERAVPVLPGAVCVHVDYQSGPFADLLVTCVDGEHVQVHPVGFPGRGGCDGRTRYLRSEVLMRHPAVTGRSER